MRLDWFLLHMGYGSLLSQTAGEYLPLSQANSFPHIHQFAERDPQIVQGKQSVNCAVFLANPL